MKVLIVSHLADGIPVVDRAFYKSGGSIRVFDIEGDYAEKEYGSLKEIENKIHKSFYKYCCYIEIRDKSVLEDMIGLDNERFEKLYGDLVIQMGYNFKID